MEKRNIRDFVISLGFTDFCLVLELIIKQMVTLYTIYKHTKY